MSRTSPFRGGGGKVWNRRYLALARVLAKGRNPPTPSFTFVTRRTGLGSGRAIAGVRLISFFGRRRLLGQACMGLWLSRDHQSRP